MYEIEDFVDYHVYKLCGTLCGQRERPFVGRSRPLWHPARTLLIAAQRTTDDRLLF